VTKSQVGVFFFDFASPPAGSIAGVVIACVAVTVIGAIILACFLCKRRNKSNEPNSAELAPEPAAGNSIPEADAAKLEKLHKSSNSSNNGGDDSRSPVPKKPEKNDPSASSNSSVPAPPKKAKTAKKEAKKEISSSPSISERKTSSSSSSAPEEPKKPKRRKPERTISSKSDKKTTTSKSKPTIQKILYHVPKEANIHKTTSRVDLKLSLRAQDAATVTHDAIEHDPAEGVECVICMDSARDSVVIPCGHLCVCHACGDVLQKGHEPKCPMCRASIEGIYKLYKV